MDDNRDKVGFTLFESLDYITHINSRERYTNTEAYELIQEALAAQNAGEPRYHRLLAALGRRLTAWGERLQDHYDATRQIPLDCSPLENMSHE